MKYTPHIDGAHAVSMEDVLDLYALARIRSVKFSV
jgi:hypothetical protein